MYVINTILPIFLIIFLGLVLRRTGFIPESMIKPNNQLLYWVALPSLIFIKTSQVTIHGTAALRIDLVIFGSMVVCIGLGYLMSLLAGVPRRSIGSFVQGAFRGNLVYVGIPILFFSLSADGDSVPSHIESLIILPLAIPVILYNTAAVIILQARSDIQSITSKKQMKLLFFNIITNPLILSSVIGLLFPVFGWTVPVLIERTGTAIAQAALPLALLSIGASLRMHTLKHGLPHALLSSAVKVAVAPAVGFFIGSYLGLSPVEMRIALVYTACPTAIVSYVVAEQMGADAVMAGNIVVISTLVSFLAFTAILLFV